MLSLRSLPPTPNYNCFCITRSTSFVKRANLTTGRQSLQFGPDPFPQMWKRGAEMLKSPGWAISSGVLGYGERACQPPGPARILPVWRAMR